MPKDTIAELLARRDRVNELFLEYSDPRKMQANIDGLAGLALIGGRIDALIRQHGVRTRDLARRQHRSETK